jgi:hypothetical protein
MPQSVTDIGICNSALIKVGSPTRLLSLADNNKAALICNEQFPKWRDEVLEMHNWSFALKRAALAQNATPPAFGWTKAYDLPSDFLRLAEVDQDSNCEIQYTIENGQILTDESTFNIVYVFPNTDFSRWTAAFAEAMSFRAGRDLALALNQNSQLSLAMDQGLQRAIAAARGLNAQQKPAGELVASDWTNSRY